MFVQHQSITLFSASAENQTPSVSLLPIVERVLEYVEELRHQHAEIVLKTTTMKSYLNVEMFQNAGCLNAEIAPKSNRNIVLS